MLPQVLALNGVVPGEREEADDNVRDLLNQSGWILESRELSSNATAIAFEIPVANLEWFGSAVADTGLQLDDDSLQLLERSAASVAELEEEEQGKNIRGTLEMTFLRARKPPEPEPEEEPEASAEDEGGWSGTGEEDEQEEDGEGGEDGYGEDEG